MRATLFVMTFVRELNRLKWSIQLKSRLLRNHYSGLTANTGVRYGHATLWLTQYVSNRPTARSKQKSRYNLSDAAMSVVSCVSV